MIQFYKNAPRALGVDESVLPAAVPYLRLLVDELDVVGAQLIQHGGDVVHLEAHVVNAGAALLQEASHAGVGYTWL